MSIYPKLKEDNILGGFFGVAIGDALGATVEFMTKEEIIKSFGIHQEVIGEGWLQLEKGEITDDTAMTIDVARGILSNREEPKESIGKHFIKWYQSKPKSIGNTVKHTIENYLHLANWEVASRKTNEELDNRTAGNGSLMRTLPISFAYADDKEKMIEISRVISRMTHYNLESELSCVFYNLYAVNLLKGMDKKEAYQETLNESIRYFEDSTENRLYNRLNNIHMLTHEELKTTGYVVETLITAIHTFLFFDSFEEILIKTVNLGGDADTIGAVSGGLAGIYYGFNQIPSRWVDALKDKDEIAKLANEFKDIFAR